MTFLKTGVKLGVFLKGGRYMDAQDEVLKLHAQHQGVLEVAGQLEVHNKKQLGQAYTPGVAVLSKLLANQPELKAQYTLSGKLVAVVTDGSAVLGLGNIGAVGGLPVVEGKALLYRDLAQVNALPLAVDQVPVAEFVQTIKNTSKSFAGIHLEDIAAPRCFAIEEALQKELNIPVYHDDQEGTAIVVLAGLINAAKVVNKPLADLKVLINGIGAAGVATAKLLLAAGIRNLTLVEKDGIVTKDDARFNKYQRAVAQVTQAENPYHDVHDAIVGQDAFIGVSDANVIDENDVAQMAADPIIFGLANPKPEINPDVVAQTKTKVFATGSSQYPNQVNNILAFPGLYRGLLQTKLTKIDLDLQADIAHALANLIATPTATKIIPGVFDEGVVAAVSAAVYKYAQAHDAL